MSLRIAKLHKMAPGKKNREQLLALVPKLEYLDGRTKQSHRDETDIVKIMARFDKTGTISHMAKFEGVYADFSDFDFHAQTTKLAEGQTIFDALPAELRQEFGQSPEAFFAYVNNPENKDKLHEKLPGLAKPGRQIPLPAVPDADREKAVKAASEPVASVITKTIAEADPKPEEPE